MFAGLCYFGNLRSALATDTYTLSGRAGGETYTPRFTYHGFRCECLLSASMLSMWLTMLVYRYVQITGYPGKLTADNITMLHVRTALQYRSR